MQQEKWQIIKKRIDKTIENLKNNNMCAYYCETKEDAKELVNSLIKRGDTIANGGSVTLKETGIIDLLKNGSYNYLDRNAEGITPKQVQDIYRQAFSADAYFASCNAITETGELFNVDGNSNRVSAIVFGPTSVILVVGYNKIVSNLDEAITRLKTICAPANTVRLQTGAYCMTAGKCISLNKSNPEMTDGCHCDGRVCCNYVVSARQRQKDRIKVIVVGEELGF